jgi:sulfatase maturation enzyme AslB (radical SAM superfamily)
MCSNYASTYIGKLVKNVVLVDNQDLFHQLPIDKILVFEITGGEPSVSNLYKKSLKSLTNKTKYVRVNTNGSKFIPEIEPLLINGTNVTITLSIDGTHNVFEYIRWPLKWSQLQYNLDKFKQISRYVSVSCTISNLNIFYYAELIDFFKANQIEYLCKQVVSPSYFAPGNLPEEFKQQVLDKNKKYYNEVESFLKFGKVALDKFWQEIDRQDQLKGINIRDYLPELANARI